jgi:hypothetical protein
MSQGSQQHTHRISRGAAIIRDAAPEPRSYVMRDIAPAARRRSSVRDAKSSLGDAKSSLGDAKSSLGDAKSSLG